MPTDYSKMDKNEFAKLYSHLIENNVPGSLLEESILGHGLGIYKKVSYPLEFGFLIVDLKEYRFWNSGTDELELEETKRFFSFTTTS